MNARTALALFAPPLALMGLIYFLSDQPDLDSGLGLIDLIGRKLLHALIYATLCALWWRALSRGAPTSTTALLAALAITIAYAISDEYHQTFVEGRAGSPIDVAIDTIGAGLAAVAIRRRAGPRGANSRD